MNKNKLMLPLLTLFIVFANAAFGQVHPEAINCLYDKYVSEIPNKKEWRNESIKENYLWLCLTRGSYTSKTKVIDSGQVISIDAFSRPNSKGKRDGFDIEIWRMTSSEAAIDLSDTLELLMNSDSKIEKPAKSVFVYKNYIVILQTRWWGEQYRIISEEYNKMLKCFEPDKVRIFSGPIYPEERKLMEKKK